MGHRIEAIHLKVFHHHVVGTLQLESISCVSFVGQRVSCTSVFQVNEHLQTAVGR